MASVNPMVSGSVVGGDIYVPEKLGLSCAGSAQVGVVEKLAVMVVFAVMLKGPQVPVPLHDALPVVLQPVKVESPLGVAVHAPTDVPEARVALLQFVPETDPVPDPAVDTVKE